MIPINNDLLLSLSSFFFVICAIPQLIRNWKYKDTITQSLMTNGLILGGTVLTIIAYVNLHLVYALIFLIAEAIITTILLIQIIVWRNKRKMKPVIQQTEAVRSIIRTVKGMK